MDTARQPLRLDLLPGAPGPEPAPYAAPARRTDLAGLAPAWIGVGTLDLFHDEDVDYAERLAAAGVPVDLVVVDGMWHAADMVVDSPTMAQFRSSMTDALRHGTDSRTDPRGVSAATDVTG
ncbi:MAG: alpha/beta hydrolase fold domain-containing protein [Mobilicoccus sp.]|nr:alpha/beta hydrolase fold domain-containing protein [Mobilicoccus sp.]